MVMVMLSAAARKMSSRNFYKMGCVFYDVLATIYLTKVNLLKQYLTQNTALVYGCDISCTNFNHPPTTSTTTLFRG
jgi:hypothetical protein